MKNLTAYLKEDIWNHPRKAMKELKSILNSIEYSQIVNMYYDPELNNWREWVNFIDLVRKEAGYKKLLEQLKLVWDSRIGNLDYWDKLPEEVKTGIANIINRPI